MELTLLRIPKMKRQDPRLMIYLPRPGNYLQFYRNQLIDHYHSNFNHADRSKYRHIKWN